MQYKDVLVCMASMNVLHASNHLEFNVKSKFDFEIPISTTKYSRDQLLTVHSTFWTLWLLHSNIKSLLRSICIDLSMLTFCHDSCTNLGACLPVSAKGGWSMIYIRILCIHINFFVNLFLNCNNTNTTKRPMYKKHVCYCTYSIMLS